MFFKRDYIFFLSAGLLLTAGFVMMAMDPAPNGFGVWTLWIAPPLLLSGFLLPVIGIGGLRILPVRLRYCSGKHIAGFFVFLAALLVYVVTLEPTASLWDCSEFIACAYKLQVPHTPGTPLSLLFGRLFTMLAFGDVTRVAWSLNFMSGLFSAFTVYLVYHVIFYLGKQVIGSGRKSNLILILSSCGGSLSLAFSDTFWFSAVEAETYGAACFFLMLLVWLILSGKDLSGPLRPRRLVLIFYVAGLSYCIHPMCLLALPLLPFTWYLRGKSLSFGPTALLIAAGLLIVLLINRFIAVGMFELVFSLDKFFVNVLRFPFYSGAVILLSMTVFLFVVLLRRFHRQGPYLWSLIFILLGFTPYLLLFIRSNQNPPIDETNPESLPLIKAYMNRESYPSVPLLYGPYFDARIIDVEIKKTIFYQDQDCYKVAGSLPEYRYDARQTFLPRMYSNDEDHVDTYRSWVGLRDNIKPRFFDNLNFMFTYQLGHMYFRYLMWNFSGRAGDVQNSVWLKPWDRLQTSSFERARNQYWMIPFFLGIVGAVFQCRRDPRGFISVAILFFVTGVILAIYLNAPPNEPRERDYIYVGSFVAFCLWIGLGIAMLAARMRQFKAGIPLVALISLCIPLWMFCENYDDHNRAGRTFQVDNARNILNSCAPNSILFTGGDNDTFPLWYLQEVEGFRTDVRVMVLSYMNTDWYINQLRNAYYDSGAFRLTLDEDDYRQYGPNDVLYVQETIKDEINVKQFLRLLKEEHPALQMRSRNGAPFHILPSRSLKIEGSEPPRVKQSVVSTEEDDVAVRLHIAEDYLPKNLLAILDLVVSNEWARPVYFNFTSMNSVGADISAYVIQEGPVFRLRPEKRQGESIAVNTSVMYRNIVEQAHYGNLADASIYFSYEDHYARMIVPVRQSFNDLARAFLHEGNDEMARKVLREAIDKLYRAHLRPSYTNLEAAEMLISLNEHALANALCTAAFGYFQLQVEASERENRQPSRLDLYLVQRSAELMAKMGDDSLNYEQQ